MGLRNNEVLNSLCPGAIRASDIDNVLHNGRISPERVAFFEYKNGVSVTGGQRWLLDSLAGSWTEKSGRRLETRWYELPLYHEPQAEILAPIIGWLFP